MKHEDPFCDIFTHIWLIFMVNCRYLWVNDGSSGRVGDRWWCFFQLISFG